MLLLNLPTADVAFQLAAEEHLFRNLNEPCFMLWSCPPAVVAGINQNLIAEIDCYYARKHGIKPARRMSGGGTVYHDTGNLNFTVIDRHDPTYTVDFKSMLMPVVDALHDAGLPVRVGARNELLLDEHKISGTAGHVSRGKALLHGTLLFDADLDSLKAVLNARRDIFTGKATPSVPGHVGNIATHPASPQSMEQFRTTLFTNIGRRFADSREYSLTASDVEAIEQLAREKYNSWDWTFGRSPRYEMHHSARIGNIDVSITIAVKHGIIQSAELHAVPDHPHLKDIAAAIVGTRHQGEALRESLKAVCGLEFGVCSVELCDIPFWFGV